MTDPGPKPCTLHCVCASLSITPIGGLSIPRSLPLRVHNRQSVHAYYALSSALIRPWSFICLALRAQCSGIHICFAFVQE